MLTTDCPAGPTGGEQWSHAFGAHDYDQLLLQGYDDYAPDYFSEPDDLDPVVLGASSWINHHYGILDGGATSSCASYEIVQSIADSWEPLEKYPECEAKDKSFVFGGGEQSQSKTRAWLPNDLFPDGIGVNVLPNEHTPLLIGTDMLRYYGMVLDYGYNTVYSHRLKRDIPCTVLKSGHIAISMTPNDRDY